MLASAISVSDINIPKNDIFFNVRDTSQNSVAIFGIKLKLDSNNERRYYFIMIKSFKCKETESIFNGHGSRRFSALIRPAMRKLEVLNAAEKLSDLRVPPGNMLEKLKGNRLGQHSIRINDQWRICFVWNNGNASDVEIVDYH
jgi:proteic killer suppression protein